MAIIAVIGYAFLLISGFLAKTGTLGFALLVLGYCSPISVSIAIT